MKNILYTIILSFLFSSSVFAGENDSNDKWEKMMIEAQQDTKDFTEALSAIGAKDYKTAFNIVMRLVKKEVPHVDHGTSASFILGHLYHHGYGVDQDYNEAIKWYHRALEEEDDAGDVMREIGLMHEAGQGVTQDYKEAVRWFRRAAEKGDRNGQFDLGLSYFNGQGVIQDYKEAERFWRLAAEDGHLESQNSLGHLYAQGKGVIKDYAIAYMWFNIAASRGNKIAVKNRDAVQENMTTSQIESAQKMTRECIEKNKKEVTDRLPDLPPTSTFVEMVMDYKDCG